MTGHKNRLPQHATKEWVLDAACATPAGRALIDLLTDYPSHWENTHVWERIRTLCDECPVKPECRMLGQEHAATLNTSDKLIKHMPYAGHPLKHYRDNLAA